jgi:hypothetical protein
MNAFDRALIQGGLYYLRQVGSDTLHPVMTVGDTGAMLVYSTAEKAHQAAADLGGADVLYSDDVSSLFIGLPAGATHLLLDYEPATGEGWLLGPEDV